VKKPGYETQTQYVKINNKVQQSEAQRLDFTLESTSSDRLHLQQKLRQFMNKV
jgi:hypothetical protein